MLSLGLGLWNAAKGIASGVSLTNYARWSEVFGNVVWSPVGMTITSDAVLAPDGNLTADTLVATTTANAVIIQDVTITAGSTNRVSLYVKAGTVGWCRIRTLAGVDNKSTFFNAATGAVGTVGTTGTEITALTATSGSVEANGFVRVSVTVTTASATTLNIGIGLASADNNLTYTIGSTLSVWGAQVNKGASLLGYVPTTTAPA